MSDLEESCTECGWSEECGVDHIAYVAALLDALPLDRNP